MKPRLLPFHIAGPLVFLLFFQTLFAQTGPNLRLLAPPPPEVSALGKFGLIPVSTFSGVPDISYPVYTIKEGTLSFPISLKYYAGGLTVKEDASEVGLGWALSASGSIISSTRGEPDFPGGFQNTYVDMPDAPDVIKTFKNPINSVEDYYYMWPNDFYPFAANNTSGMIYSGLALPHNGVSKEYFNYFQVGYEGRAPDFASDLYRINIGDKSYKFIFDNNFKPVVLGDGSLKIELIPNGNYPDWKVTDESGVVYYFTQRQLSYTNSSDTYYIANRTSITVNTWYLTRIVSPVNGEIDFNYLYSTQQVVHPLPNVSETYLVGNASPHTQQSIENVVPSFTTYQQLNLSSITFSDGLVRFLYDDQRLDLDGARRLQTIEVRNKQSKLLKKVTLDNNYYFTATAGDNGGITEFSTLVNNLTQYSSANHFKRLKLNAIIETDSTGTQQNKKTSYTYNEQLNLPAKLSLAIDHWGYYNGATNSQLIPPATVYLSSSGTPIVLTGANREANPAYMQANMLTSIMHPTGGTSSFSYETNQYTQQEDVTTYRDTSGQGYKAVGTPAMNSYTGMLSATGSFTAGTTWNNKRLYISCLIGQHDTYPSDYTLTLVVYRDNSVINRINIPRTQFSTDTSTVITGGSTYKLVFEPSSPVFYMNCDIRLQTAVTATSSTTTSMLVTHYSGGLRVSQIKDFDPVSQVTNIKKYTYFNGVPDDRPVYVSKEGTDYYNGSTANVFKYRYGQSIYPFSSGRDAAFFGYGKVQVSDSNQNNLNGMTEYTYNSNPSLNVNTMLDQSNVFNKPQIINPIVPPIPAITIGRGDLIEEKQYKLAGTNLVPVAMTHYYYDRDNPIKIWQMLFNSGLSGYTSPGFDNGQEFKIYASQFPVLVFRNGLKRKEHTEYDVAGNTAQSTYENYVYDKLNGHYQLIKKTTGTSKADTLNTYYKYPQDYPDLQTTTGLDSASNGIKLLQQKHLMVPLESYTERITTTPSVPKQYFGALLNIFNPDQPTLKQVQVLETIAPLNTFSFSSVTGGALSKNAGYASRLQLKYDNIGRLLQEYPERGVSTVYLWGSNLLVPLAKVTNAIPADVAFTSFEADGDGSWTVASASRDNSIALTGKSSYNLSGGALSKSGLTASKTYILSYWTRNSSALNVAGTVSGYPVKGGTSQGWTYYQHLITGQATITLSGTGNVDDVRLYPSGALMTTYTYDPLVGLTSSTDGKGEVTTYEYDNFQRLMNVKDKDGNIIKHMDYHYLAQ